MSLHITAITVLLLLFALWVILSRAARRALGRIFVGTYWFAIESLQLCRELVRGRPAASGA